MGYKSGDKKVLAAVTENIPCRCGTGHFFIARGDDGMPSVVHSMPACKELLAIDDPADFLHWVRTGELPN